MFGILQGFCQKWTDCNEKNPCAAHAGAACKQNVDFIESVIAFLDFFGHSDLFGGCLAGPHGLQMGSNGRNGRWNGHFPGSES